MMKKYTLLLLLAVLLAASLACRVDRIFNPALPTFTPTTEVAAAPTITPTPPPITTPEPGARITSGDQAYFIGDWDLALNEYAQALDQTAENEVKAAAMLGLGRTYLRTGQTQAALDTVNNAIAAYPGTNSLADLYFVQGEIFEILDRPAEAADAFLRYQQLRPGLIDAAIYERIGDNLTAAQNYQPAIDAYLLAIQSPALSDTLYLNLRIGSAYLALGDLQTAYVTYEDVFNRTSNDFQKAEARRQMAEILITQGASQEAYPIYQEIVTSYPVSYDAYLALVSLLDAGQTVSDFDRGLINYFVKQYGLAVDALVRYLNANPDQHESAAHYYLGLAYLNLGEYQQAIDAWQALIDEHINERFWVEAFDEIAYTQSVFLNRPENAIETYLEFVDRSPLHEKSPEYLFYAARAAERDFDLATAATLWERIGTQFSTSTWAFDGLFQAGIARYRLGEYDIAISTWQSALGVTTSPDQTAAAYFWIGKAYQQKGQTQAASDAWLQASTSDPTGYYSERAADLLAGLPAFSPPAAYSLNVDLPAARSQAVEWVRTTFSLPADEDLTDPATLFSDPRMVRGAELWRLGQYEAARREFESYRLAVQDDPGKTFRLAEYLIEIGMYRSGVIAARRVLDLAGLDDAGTLTAPVYFNYLRFGTYFREIVLPEAEEYGFHPLFIYSVMRQESLFEGFVTSTAGARGLMQVIPSTGEEIARTLNWPPSYTADDLYRPVVSVPFGVSYLDRQRDFFDGDLFAALAAYNGGAGNASSWRSLANGDPDLFVEVIRFTETRNYIRSIYELYDIYVGIYGQ
jgi:soluble lytic murein transglycosylase